MNPPHCSSPTTGAMRDRKKIAEAKIRAEEEMAIELENRRKAKAEEERARRKREEREAEERQKAEEEEVTMDDRSISNITASTSVRPRIG